MYEVRLSAEAEKAYGNLEHPDLAKVNRGLAVIEEYPYYRPDSRYVIPLKGRLFAGKYRCKVSQWRIIYSVDEQQKTVKVEAIVRRRESTYRR